MKKGISKNKAKWRQIMRPIKWSRENWDFYVRPNTWKIRGWKRRLRKLNRWGKAILTPNLIWWERNSSYDPNNFRTYPYTYDQYKAYPWYGPFKLRRAPLWFHREIIRHLINAFENWDEIFAKRAEPYDLFIRLYDPNYILSDVHCTRMEKSGDRYIYWPESEKKKEFPFKKFETKFYNLSNFDWELRVEEEVIFSDDLAESGYDESKLLKKGYKKHEGTELVYYAKPVGDVWVGRKKIS